MLVPLGSGASLVASFRDVLSQLPAQRHVLDHFTRPAKAAQLLEIYRRELRSSAAPKPDLFKK